MGITHGLAPSFKTEFMHIFNGQVFRKTFMV